MDEPRKRPSLPVIEWDAQEGDEQGTAERASQPESPGEPTPGPRRRNLLAILLALIGLPLLIILLISIGEEINRVSV